MERESENVEFTRKLTDSIVKEIISFCNTNGGTIFIGYDDNGNVIGLDNAKDDLDELNSKINDSIEPSVNFLVSNKIGTIENKEIIVINILKGTNKPYYIKSKGMTPEGVYIRLGATVQHAKAETIKEMIMTSSGITFEQSVSTNQTLTFNYAEKLFEEHNIKFGKTEKKNLELINEDGNFTNLGLLISDQCPYSIKVAKYKDKTKYEFVDSKEFGNESVLEQFKDVNDYLMLNDNLNSKIIDLNREDTYEYPKECLRELLCNLITHRNYEINGSNLIHIYTDRIEFLSVGGLVNDLTIDDIKLGNSSSRNPKLVNIFHRLNFVEAYGTGIPRIYKDYELSETNLQIKVAPNTFLATLPKYKVKDEYLTIINYLKENNTGTREVFENQLHLGKATTLKLLNDMIEKGIIKKSGNARNIIYSL